MFSMPILGPILPLPLIDLASDLQHDAFPMLSIILILSLIEPFFRYPLYSLPCLPAFFTFLLTLAIIEPALIVPHYLLIGLRNTENETVFKLLDNYTRELLSFDNNIDFLQMPDGHFYDFFLVGFGMWLLIQFRHVHDGKRTIHILRC
jgi:hypothetical protein